MTLAASGPIGIGTGVVGRDIAQEFGLPANTPFPSGFYGKGGAPASGPLSFADFYGRSNYTISADTTSVTLIGYSKGATVHISSTGSNIASIALLSGSASPRISPGPADGSSASATIDASTPNSGTGVVNATYRVTTVHGEFVDISFDLEWGT